MFDPFGRSTRLGLSGCPCGDPCYSRAQHRAGLGRARWFARVAELVDALDLGSSVERRGGSIPSRAPSGHRAEAIIFDGIRTVIKTVETENEGLKRAFMLTIPARGYRCAGRARGQSDRPAGRMPGFRPARCRRTYPQDAWRFASAGCAQQRCSGGGPAAAPGAEAASGNAAAGRPRRRLDSGQGRPSQRPSRSAARSAVTEDR